MIRAIDERLLRWADAGVLWMWNAWGVRKVVLTRSLCFLSAGLLFVGVHQLHLGLLLATAFQIVTQGLSELVDDVGGNRDAGFWYRLFVLGLTAGSLLTFDPHMFSNVVFVAWYYVLFAVVPKGPRRRRERKHETKEAWQGAS